MVKEKQIKSMTKAQRYSESEFSLISKEAKKQHLEISTFIRKCALDIARGNEK